jgi:hypothetical protein
MLCPYKWTMGVQGGEDPRRLFSIPQESEIRLRWSGGLKGVEGKEKGPWRPPLSSYLRVQSNTRALQRVVRMLRAALQAVPQALQAQCTLNCQIP